MKNLTVALGDKSHRLARLAAAHRGVSMSRYVATLIDEDVGSATGDSDAEGRRRLEALEQFLSGPKLTISEAGRMPNAEERNARR